MKIEIKDKSYEEFIPIYMNNNVKKYILDVIYKDKNNNLGHYNSLVDYKIFLKNGEIFNNIQKQLKNHNYTDTCIYDKRQCLCIVK